MHRRQRSPDWREFHLDLLLNARTIRPEIYGSNSQLTGRLKSVLPKLPMCMGQELFLW